MNNQLILKTIAILSCIFAASSASTFETPDILKDNVAFWKQIYTEVSLNEGLLHDSEHPMVIYARIATGNRHGKERERFISSYKNEILSSLEHITSQSESLWTETDRKTAILFEEHAGGKNAVFGACERLRFQQGQKERFYEGLCRSGAYLDTIKSILASYNVPQELAFLPHVESSFNPAAYSKVGAAGLWQFMRSTGRIYLTVNYTIDERRDAVSSSIAAAKLLSHNYSQLQSWPLAITAYNHGLNGMKRAVASTNSHDIAVILEKHESPSFKFASKNFYGCFLAVCEIAGNPQKYFSDVKYSEPARVTDIMLKNSMRPSVIASAVSIDRKMLAQLNPAIRTVVIQQDNYIPAGTRIHLPASINGSFVDSAMAMIPESLANEKPLHPEYYRISQGENLFGIAKKTGVSVQALAEENDINSKGRIYSGQILRIPGIANKSQPDAIASFVDDKRTETRLAVRTQTPRQAANSEAQKADRGASQSAAKLLTPDKTAKSADTIADTLKEVIMIKAAKAPVISGKDGLNRYNLFDADVYHLDVEISAIGDAASILVAVDETIGHYADWAGVPAWRIKQINRLGNNSVINTGRRLNIPGDSAAIYRFVEKRLEYHMSLEEDFFSQFKIVETRERKVSRGDNLWTLASSGEDQIPLWLLRKFNRDTDFSKLIPGQTIIIPVAAEKTNQDYEQENNRTGVPVNFEPLMPTNKPARLTR
jgi:membrane-bound lytic murein transglycosylase D